MFDTAHFLDYLNSPVQSDVPFHRYLRVVPTDLVGVVKRHKYSDGTGILFTCLTKWKRVEMEVAA
jgi:hypothetical protein